MRHALDEPVYMSGGMFTSRRPARKAESPSSPLSVRLRISAEIPSPMSDSGVQHLQEREDQQVGQQSFRRRTDPVLKVTRSQKSVATSSHDPERLAPLTITVSDSMLLATDFTKGLAAAVQQQVNTRTCSWSTREAVENQGAAVCEPPAPCSEPPSIAAKMQACASEKGTYTILESLSATTAQESWIPTLVKMKDPVDGENSDCGDYLMQLEEGGGYDVLHATRTGIL